MEQHFVYIDNGEARDRLVCEYLAEKNYEVTFCPNDPAFMRTAVAKKNPRYFMFSYAEDETHTRIISMVRRQFPSALSIVIIPVEKFTLNCLMDYDVSAYLSSNFTMNELNNCMNTLENGCRYISADIREKLAAIETFNPEDLFTKLHLTNREVNILRMILEGHSSQKISEELFISINTLNNHKTNMRNKLNLKSNRDLLFFSIKYRQVLMNSKRA